MKSRSATFGLAIGIVLAGTGVTDASASNYVLATFSRAGPDGHYAVFTNLTTRRRVGSLVTVWEYDVFERNQPHGQTAGYARSMNQRVYDCSAMTSRTQFTALYTRPGRVVQVFFHQPECTTRDSRL